MYENIYLILVIFLLLLATMDLFVGVSNDAVNFLNSAVGCRIATLRTILLVASIGVLFGATFSSGMMEVARSGVFYPQNYTFEQIMTVFLAVMITDVLLLNLFNSLGLPTSTTVSIVFELLGSSFCAAVYSLMLSDDSLTLVFDYIKSDKAVTIISAILVSVAVAFISGAFVQFILRVLFSFKFQNSYKYLGGIYAGFSLTAIIYFLVVKGAKGASFMKAEYLQFIDAHTSNILLISFIGITIISQIFVFLKFNVFKVIILSGTFALAFSFAGNDLVNFIGVPLAALDSFLTWHNSGYEPSQLMMDSLNDTAKTSTVFLVIAGLIMVITLWTSKKAHRVIQTSINLSSSTRGDHEQFGASPIGRVVTRVGLGMSRTTLNILPAFMLAFFAKRYEKEALVKGEIALPFDYVRASINLVLASILISSATSLKLPLSTTYVTFMVAMGTSFADGAWDRESAVYRISGVITVIAGWFLTGLCAFTASFLVCLAFLKFGLIAVFLAIAIVIFVVIRSNFVSQKVTETVKQVIAAKGDNKKILQAVSSAVPNFFDNNVSCLKRALESFFDDNETQIRKARNKASNILDEISRERTAYYSMALEDKTHMLMSKSEQKEALDAMHFFYLSFSNMREASKSVRFAIDQALNHVANRHTIFGGTMKEILEELLLRMHKLTVDMHCIADNPSADSVETLVKHAKKLNRDIDRAQVELVNLIGVEKISMHSSEMFLTFLQSIRDVANRYVAVAMQERALARIAHGANDGSEDPHMAQMQTQIMPAAYATNNDEIVVKTQVENSDIVKSSSSNYDDVDTKTTSDMSNTLDTTLNDKDSSDNEQNKV